MQFISSVELRRMLIGAYLQVLSAKDRINKINYFPVPDRDTGNNLVRTMKGVYDALASVEYADIASLRHEALEGALTMAAGNAGIITTSFLGGFLETCTEDSIATPLLVTAFSNGSLRAYESVQDPKKGTILDVMDYTASRLREISEGSSVRTVLEQSVVFAHEGLQSTRGKMKGYRRSAVVDAGGLGFVMMLEGFLRGYNNTDLQLPAQPLTLKQSKVLTEITVMRYEVVSLLESLKVDRESILRHLVPHGDCIDIAVANDKMKIHIHTDVPHVVTELIPQFGAVLQMKTVDMNQGETGDANQQGKIGIVTDEGASLSLSYATEQDIALVPFQISWDDTDTIPKLKNKNIYEKMRFVRNSEKIHSLPKTSQPSSYSYLKAFKDQLQKYPNVVCIVTSSVVSGSYNSALHARNQLSTAQKERVHIPDLRQALAGQTLLVHSTVDFRNKQENIQDLTNHLHSLAKEIDVFGFGDDAYWMVKGGRLSANKAKLLTFILKLGIQPVVGVKKGKLGIKGFARRRASLADMAHEYIVRKYGKASENYSLVVHHADSPTELLRLKEKLDSSRFTIVDEALLSPVVGAHTGPDTMIIGIRKT